jgi:glycosyltransferase involved in cell wall biosynthesis
MKRYIAVQIGARRAYAVPSILEDAGMLEAFYTDLCGSVGWGHIISHLAPSFLRRGPVKNLIGRQLLPNLKGKTHTFPGPTLRYYLRSRLGKQDFKSQDKIWKQFENELARNMIQLGIGRATHLFSMAGECTSFIEFAKQQGLTILTEFFITLTVLEILRPEREAFPELETHPDQGFAEATYSLHRMICDVTDWAIVPSEQVRQDLVERFGMDRDRCFLIPYAVHASWLDLQNQPIRGRVLFVGNAGLRKGIHYLGMASQILGHRGYEFRVAGSFTRAMREHRLGKNLNFLGHVPRSEIREEYQKADIFVLPSLAEGSAEVTYEALATGLPVITTEAAGSVVRDGVEGFIVPERDAQALAERIEELVENRELRHRMAAAAKDRAKDYTWDKYAERLLAVFKTV